MRFVASCVVLLTTAALPASEPSVDSVDYAAPSKYMAIAPSLGDRAEIASLGSSLKGDADRATLRNVLGWMAQNLKYDPDRAYAWRNWDDVMREKTYGGCADQGIICGVLLKAAGIPAIWVKTMDVSWIWDFKKGRPFKSWSGHVFLEVWVDRKWMLLDPGSQTLYEDYSPKARILPGNRFAYHKGDDPKEMIMSLQWEEWKQQTSTYFRQLDDSLLPVDPAGGTRLQPLAFIAGNSPYYQVMAGMASERGFTVVASFNHEYDKYLPQARGHVLLVETHNGVPIVPMNLLAQQFPNVLQGLRNADGIAQVEGTTILFVDFSKLLGRIETKPGAAPKSSTATAPAPGDRR